MGGTPINIPHHQHSSIASLDAKGPDGWQSMHQHSSQVSMNAPCPQHQLIKPYAGQDFFPWVLSPVPLPPAYGTPINIPHHQHQPHQYPHYHITKTITLIPSSSTT